MKTAFGSAVAHPDNCLRISAGVFLVLMGLTLTSASAVPATPGYALQLNGSTGYVSTTDYFNNPQTFTISIWFNTTTTNGGRLLGFGSSQTGASGMFDRQFYMDNSGHIIFGINPVHPQIISNTVACNDGNWHQAVGTLSSSTGLSLYIDGVLATNQADFTQAQNYGGYWRMGYDSLNTWPDLPTSNYFEGTIDEVQIWSTALTADQIQTNLHLFQTNSTSGMQSCWHFDEGSGTTTADASGNGNTGYLEGGVAWVNSTAPIGLPQVTNLPASGVSATVATFNGLVLPNYQQTAAWFQYGLSTNYTLASSPIAIGANNSSSVSVSQNIGGLQQGTLYHCQLVASNSAGTNYGADLTFTTLTYAQFLLPQTLPATRATGSGATLNGSINPNGQDVHVWFEWGTTPMYGSSTPVTDLGQTAETTVLVSARIFGLQGGQAYHFRLVATNGFGEYIGVDRVLEAPLLALYGDNPLTNCFGVPFDDPGYGLAPAEPLAIAASDDDELGTEENDFALVLTADGTVVAWGYNGNDETNVPSNLSNVVVIATGDRNSLALETNGTVVSWGANFDGTSIPLGLSNVVAIAAGNEFGLALQSDGTVVGWGRNNEGQTNIPPGLTNVVAIAAGDDFSLALLSDGTVVNWGFNPDGYNTPPFGLNNVVAIAAGNGFSLALQSNGTVVGWGDSADDYDEIPLPANLSNVVDIAVGGYFGMVLQNDGTIVGWGNNPAPGGIGIIGWDLNDNKAEIASASNFGLSTATSQVQSDALVAIAAGNDFSLAIAGNGDVVGGGDNAYGNLNIPSGLNVSSAPITITGAVNVDVPGIYRLTYAVTNFMGAFDTVTRTVVVTPPPPPAAFNITGIGQGQFELQFSGNTNAGYTVLTATNLLLPLTNWTVIGSVTNISSGLFQFTTQPSLSDQQRFYRIRSP